MCNDCEQHVAYAGDLAAIRDAELPLMCTIKVESGSSTKPARS